MMIKLQGVSFKYKDGDSILNDVNFVFEEGETYVLQGSNGAGKTTLLRLLCGLLKLDKGKIEIPKNSIVSFLPDSNGIYENMTILENIKFRVSLYSLKYKDIENEIQELLIKYNLDIPKDKLVSELSLGMKKKVALICTLIVNPTIMILDEPTVGVDIESRSELIEMLNTKKNDNVIIVITSHDKEFIEQIRAEKINLKDGVITNATSV